ncbi:MAG: RNA-binding protein [Clostridiales bacterium]|nr:RNA-binding protein [Clostridiales bacterium]
MKEQDALFKKRLQDLARTAYYRDIAAFTDFLDLNELHMVHSFRPEENGVVIRYFGGYEGAERQIAAFFPDALSYEDERDGLSMYPIDCLKISPSSKKFCEYLSHRDYLGALVHLGIDRCKLGDIVIKDQEAYLFCHEQMTDFLLQNLDRVRHTSVKAEKLLNPQELPQPELKEIRGTVASVRLDSMIALAFSSSRSGMLGLIEGGKVFVNGKMVVSNGHPLKPGDVVSVRGHGKFRYKAMENTTKKGRCYVVVQRYV